MMWRADGDSRARLPISMTPLCSNKSHDHAELHGIDCEPERSDGQCIKATSVLTIATLWETLPGSRSMFGHGGAVMARDMGSFTVLDPVGDDDDARLFAEAELERLARELDEPAPSATPQSKAYTAYVFPFGAPGYASGSEND